MPIRIPLCLLGLTMTLVVSMGSLSAEPKSLRPIPDVVTPMPDVVTFIIGRGRSPRPEYPDYWGKNSLGYGCWPILDEENPNDRSAFFRLGSSNFSFVYNDLHVGDVIPIVRGVYQVESLTPGKMERFSSAEVICRRIETPPEGAKVTPGAYAFVFHPKVEKSSPFRLQYFIVNGQFIVNGINFTAEFIPEEADIPMAVKVDVLDPTVPSEMRIVNGIPVKSPITYTVRVGDLLKLGKFTHRVVNIVPPDPEQHVIGWFEINIEPEPDPKLIPNPKSVE